MKPLREVYCVKCASIVSRELAEHVFKTGFYKITTPLAICTKCAHGEAEKIHIEFEPAGFNDEIYEETLAML